VPGSPIPLRGNDRFEPFLGFCGGGPSGRSNLRQSRILAILTHLMVELICEYLVFDEVSVTYCDFGVVREFSALPSILEFMGFNVLKTSCF
jgi:hypothetical protein